MSVFWLFLRVGLMRYDQMELLDYIRLHVVDRLSLLTDEDMNEIESMSRASFGSTKITSAFLVGNKLGSLFWGSGLVLLVLLPSLVIMGILLFYGRVYLDQSMIPVIGAGIIPVLAALFVAQALDYAKLSRLQLGNIKWLIVLVLAVIVFVILAMEVAVGLGLLFLLFICFFKGGETS